MPLVKSKGQMYPWVSHCHSHLAGACQNGCAYCYVKSAERRYGMNRYVGPVRLDEKELLVKYGKGRTIFIEHMNDLLAEGVTDDMVRRILHHVAQYPDNVYVFQSKNPERFMDFIDAGLIPENSILGTTIESNRDYPEITSAPPQMRRVNGMSQLPKTFKRFLTIEPVLEFDVEPLATYIAMVNPDFLNLGADSKNNNLPEPTVEKIMQLVAKLHEFGIELREKENLHRLKQK